jgi:hypothetical protein
MSHSHLTDWIEDKDEREICRDVTFAMEARQTQYFRLGTTIAKVAAWWHHNITEDVLPVHHEPRTRY